MGNVRAVVSFTPVAVYVDSTGMASVKIPELGLSAYGETYDYALLKLEAMLVEAMHAHRVSESLEAWLKSSGLTWEWEDTYTGEPPIDGTLVVAKVRGLLKARGRKPIEAPEPYEVSPKTLALAA